MPSNLGKNKLNGQARDIRNDNNRKRCQQTIANNRPKSHHFIRSQIMLIAYIPNAKKQGWHQGNNDSYHSALQIHCITDMASTTCCLIWNEKKTLESLKGGFQPSKTSPLNKIRLDMLNITLQSSQAFFHTATPLFLWGDKEITDNATDVIFAS